MRHILLFLPKIAASVIWILHFVSNCDFNLSINCSALEPDVFQLDVCLPELADLNIPQVSTFTLLCTVPSTSVYSTV